ncbi:MAG: Na/Pi cotransporter family protein [Opitutaceae bacterium]|nr:Na/Pi cotransporter family protein [Opitutaceae bacterium]
MSYENTLSALGGLALFLLALQMMTEGLRTFAGAGLKALLGRWTSTAWRGVVSGILITGLVQSSSAVTVATIGFVNAGLLTLRQALGVVFGTNVGTTMTGWFVSLVGFGFKIESFALPILTVGVAMRLLAPGKRHQGLGQALAGFGLFFLGLAILKDAFGGLAETYGTSISGSDQSHWLAFLLVGFVATLLTQSSSAAIAIILTAAAGGIVGVEAAAAAVIGANIGTTSSAALAVIKATPSAKRLALGHIAFNVITGVVALALLPAMLWWVGGMARWFGVEQQPAVFLALFHTAFNVLGVALMLPFANRLARWLERLFHSAEEDLGRPQHLDDTLVSTPELAVSALREELLRLRALVNGIVRSAISRGAVSPNAVETQAAALRTLGATIANFVARVRTEKMSSDAAEELALTVRIARYLEEAARLAPLARTLCEGSGRLADPCLRTLLERSLSDVARCVALAERTETASGNDAERTTALEQFQDAYQQAKAGLLAAVVGGRLSVDATDALLDDLSATRRLLDQLVKADRLLRTPSRANAIEQENNREGGVQPPRPMEP